MFYFFNESAKIRNAFLIANNQIPYLKHSKLFNEKKKKKKKKNKYLNYKQKKNHPSKYEEVIYYLINKNYKLA
ncbi:hypothetical protein, partial [Oceanihabitans sediminis]|uniref:hypothetical protein n=1 Tax=Oceanihabitans sediminis TaxID=1812012 RepID=UPI00299D3A88